MSTQLVTQIDMFDKDNLFPINDISIHYNKTGEPVVTSIEVAHHFGKKHKNILREIKEILPNLTHEQRGLTFELTHYEVDLGNGYTRKEEMFLLTEEGFTLLAMGFNGKQYIKWKLRYIMSFKKMRRFFTEGELEALQTQAYNLGVQNTRSEMLPLTRAVEIETKESYLKGMKEGKRLQKREDTLLKYKKVQSYKKKGLKSVEIAKLIGMTPEGVRELVKRVHNTVAA